MKISGNYSLNNSINHIKDISNKKTDFESLLESAKINNNKEDLRKAANEMESVFIKMILSEMRKTIPKSDIFNKSFSEEVYRDMLDDEYAKRLSESSALGISDIIYNEFVKFVKDK